MRSWVSLLLFIHVFALFVAVTAYTRPSTSQEQIHALFSPYLRNLHLTPLPVTYPFARFHMTHATPTDIDFSCEVELPSKDGAAAKIALPAEGLWPLVRYRRYQSLANAAGTLASGEEGDERSGILPRAIAGSILQQQGAREGTFRCRAHFLPEIEYLSGSEATERAALNNYRDIYEARVFVSSSGIELLKKSSTLEAAPVETGPKSKAKANP